MSIQIFNIKFLSICICTINYCIGDEKMSKRISNCARFAVALIVLTNCSNESKTEYLAKESHLENIIYVGKRIVAS